ncbi:MAG: Smr/MutS family protein [Desulfuromonadales bacterium]
MARKKASKHTVSLSQDFSSSPFKNLQGLSLFAEQKPLQQGGATRQATVDVKKLNDPSSGPHSFADEMDSLGVKPLAERACKGRDPAGKPEMKPSQSSPVTQEDRERAVFLDAVGTVDKLFKDAWPEEKPARLAVPRRMKQVERGQLKPETELDLHGLTVDEASAKVGYFLMDASHQGFQTVLIITGKGLHSSDGPVLRQAVEKLLNHHREQVLEWGIAPRRYGGGGALIVFLRQVAVTE